MIGRYSNLAFISKWVLEAGTEKKTPTYILEKYLGSSPLLEYRGRKGRRYLYYKPNRGSNKPDAPAINLQGVGGLNITGLRWLTKDGWKLQEISAYGEASQSERSKDGKLNYMHPHRADAYLFKFGAYVAYTNANEDCLLYVPSVIYFAIIRNERLRAKDYCKAVALGLIDAEIERLKQEGICVQLTQ
ncbi:MAG: hypothetical protein J6X91_05080 [Bacteroidales bacterium]|nr:hypothetical protein [Bacteroidales bacterium]